MTVKLISLGGLEAAIASGLLRGLGWGATGVWWGRTLANLANGLLFGLRFRRGRWKHKDV
jgi:Na+-driven multidrug efflux pump